MPELQVAIAESDPMLRSLYQKMVFLSPGFAFDGFADSGSGLENLLSKRLPNLVLLEITLSGMEGLDGLRRIRSSFPRVDFIVLSSSKEPDIVRGALCAGAFDYLIKPFEWERLTGALDAYRKFNLGLTGRCRPWRQGDLDKLMGLRNRLARSEHAPKGFQDKLLTQVKNLLQESVEPLSAADVGCIIGVSRSTARRYLELLVEHGEIEVDYEMRVVGRPLKRYGFFVSGCQN